MKKQLVLMFAIIMFLGVTGLANAIPILDQANPSPGSAAGLEVRSDRTHAQIFTVGITGQLTSLELWNRPSSNTPVEDLIVEIHSTLSGQPNNNLLTRVSIPVEEVGRSSRDLTIVDLTDANIFANSGDLLAIVLISSSILPRYYNWWGNIGNFYDRGTAYQSLDGGESWIAHENGDFDFHFWTYVDPDSVAPVPEPSTILLLGSGLVGLLGFGRKKLIKE